MPLQHVRHQCKSGHCPLGVDQMCWHFPRFLVRNSPRSRRQISSPLSLSGVWMAWNSTLSASDSPAGRTAAKTPSGCGTLTMARHRLPQWVARTDLHGERPQACPPSLVSAHFHPQTSGPWIDSFWPAAVRQCGDTKCRVYCRRHFATTGPLPQPDNQSQQARMERFTHTKTSQPVTGVSQDSRHGLSGTPQRGICLVDPL